MIFKKKIKLEAACVACILMFSVMAQLGAAEAKEQRELVPMGCTVGIQMYTDGVLVVGLSTTQEGTAPSPCAIAGILPGDLITAVGTDKIGSADEFKAVMSKLTSEPVSITVQRAGETLQFTVSPNAAGGAAELGLWLRDNVAGIGTLTFYDPRTGLYGGLGHGINDMDSGVIMPLGRGNIFESTIMDVKKGAVGTPGELSGAFEAGKVRGSLMKNTPYGIFGILQTAVPSADKAIPIAANDEIKLGKATIYANICGTDVQEYAVEITRVYRGDKTGRSLMLTIRDERLLERTGGIVQGMSGSPIIQNGKLVGAVTHVLVNDPTKGFGVSIEDMLEHGAKNVEKGRAA
ncbi:MAG: SpoIVB peptidase [Oscillospiraceae bacterium]